MRGIAIVYALANYLKSKSLSLPRARRVMNSTKSPEYSMWSKDIILLLSDGHVEGVQAFLDSYHGYGQKS